MSCFGAIYKARMAGMDKYRVLCYRASCIVSVFCEVVNSTQQIDESRISNLELGQGDVPTVGCNGNEVELLK